MTRLTSLVGQLSRALVAGSMLIAGCDAGVPNRKTVTDAPSDALPPGSTEGSPDMGGSSSADGGMAGAPGGGGSGGGVADASVRPLQDAAADARVVARDAARDAPRDGLASDSAVATTRGPPAPWHGKDVGQVTRRGETRATTTSFTVAASGTDIGGTADSFHFVYQPLDGDGEIVARVAALDGMTDPASKAGAMIRAGLEPEAANALLAVLGDPAVGGRFQYRTTMGGPTTLMPADAGLKTGQFLRLARVGKTFTAFRSTNRATWTRIGSIDLEMPATVYVGLATEAHSAGNVVQATYSYSTVDNVGAPWELLDVGTVGGAASEDDGLLTLSGSGDPFTPEQDRFTGVMQSVSGGQGLTALIAEQSSPHPEACVGLMFREGLVATASKSSAFAAISLSPGKGLQFHSRAIQGGMTIAGARKPEVKPPLWLRIEKVELGPLDQFTGSYSLDGSHWTLLDAAVFSVAEPLLMGVVIGAGSATAMNTAKVKSIMATALVTADGGTGDAAATVDAAAAPDAGVDAVSTD